jgi:hypothetical protein
MAKRHFMVLVLAAVAVGGLFAQEAAKKPEKAKKAVSISAGIGGLIGGDFGGGVDDVVSFENVDLGSLKYETPYFGGGGYAFFDATYAELTIGFSVGSGKSKMISEPPDLPGSPPNNVSDTSITNLSIGLLGKYPIAINPKLSVFPLLGIDYLICLSFKNDIEDDMWMVLDDNGNPSGSAGDFSALWFKIGGGVDFSFTDKIYLRFEALYGIRLANKYETDWKDYVENNSDGFGDDVEAKTLLGHGITAKLAVGYKF